MHDLELRNYTGKDLRIKAVKSKLSGTIYVKIYSASGKGELLEKHYYLQPDIKDVDFKLI